MTQKGLLDDAIPWLEKAKLARRYEPRHFPFTNLARIYEQKGRWRDAIREYQGALRFKPDLKSASQAIARLQAQMN